MNSIIVSQSANDIARVKVVTDRNRIESMTWYGLAIDLEILPDLELPSFAITVCRQFNPVKAVALLGLLVRLAANRCSLDFIEIEAGVKVVVRLFGFEGESPELCGLKKRLSKPNLE